MTEDWLREDEPGEELTIVQMVGAGMLVAFGFVLLVVAVWALLQTVSPAA